MHDQRISRTRVHRLQKEDDDFWSETEQVIRIKFGDPNYICSRRGEYKYKIRELEVKESEDEN